MPNAGDGAWPAFWLDTTSGLTGGTNEEIDILEWYGICNTPGSYQAFMQEASHSWSPNGSENPPGVPYLYSPQTPMPGGAYPWQGYHTYGFLVTTSTMTWYIDGVQEHQIATPTAYLRTPFYILVDYALGGGWPLDGTPFTTGGSSSLLVDWVRVWSVPPAPPNAIPLSVSQASGSVTLTWTNSVFTLESASNINGPYTTVMRATSPYTESASGTQKFYRLYWNGQ
jgi:beta-glucanase (GH16 family)